MLPWRLPDAGVVAFGRVMGGDYTLPHCLGLSV